MVLFEGLTTQQKISLHASLAGTFAGRTSMYNKEQIQNVSIAEMTSYWYKTHYEKFRKFPIIKADIYTKFIQMKVGKLKRMEG